MNTTTLTHMAESVRDRAADVAQSISERAPELRRDVGHRVGDVGQRVGEATHRIAAALPFVEPPRRRSLVVRFWYVPVAIVVAAVGVLAWWFATHRGAEGEIAPEARPGEPQVGDERLYAVGR